MADVMHILNAIEQGDPAAAEQLLPLVCDELRRLAADKLRYFAGLALDQAAAAIGVSTATAYRHWAYARAWLRSELLTTP
jgi:ECF sigma factor